MFMDFNKIYFGIFEREIAPVMPVLPLIAAGVSAATGIGLGLAGSKAPKLPEPKLPKAVPPPPAPAPPPPSATPQQELSSIEEDADRARAQAIAASRRRRGRMQSILTSPLGAPQPQSNLQRPVLGS